MAIAESHDFVMHALLGWSATHLAPVLSDKEMELDGYRHRDRALKGLQKAILCFSEDNADAVLCASVVMSWQSCDA
jgi:Fungal specific transcription factor domain